MKVFPFLYVVLALTLGPASMNAQNKSSFQIKGTFINTDSTPYVNRKVFAVEVSADGKWLLWVDPQKGVVTDVGWGVTDANGTFAFTIDRALFKNDTLRFTLCLGTKMQDGPNLATVIKEKAGGVLTIVVDDKIKLIDMTKVFGAITVKEQ